MTQPIAIQAENLAKHYRLYAQPIDRLKQFIFGGKRTYFKHFTALQAVNLTLEKGKVLGVIGQNGAGKSTLLQLLAGTLHPSSGSLHINGRVAALLELGAGFNPELSGADNVRFYGMLMGLSAAEVDAKFDDIVAFSGIGAFIDQPVKTYSSGMFVRLAFSIATSVEPDILIIDEALSVGDGAFARKSFDRIMELRASGVSIIFCSHALYQVQVLSDSVLWLKAGSVQALGDPREVVSAYQQFLDSQSAQESLSLDAKRPEDGPLTLARLTEVKVKVDGAQGEVLPCVCERSNVVIEISFQSDPIQPCPTVAIVFTDSDGRNISSCTTFYDKVHIERDLKGNGRVQIQFERFALMQGSYWVNVLLMCENAILTLDGVYRLVQLTVAQVGHEVGVSMLPRVWHTTAVANPSPTTT